jgi:hypothetical protein
MPQKKSKVLSANDGIIQPEHIQEAQRAMIDHGSAEMLQQLAIIEPDLAGFIAIVSNDLAAHALMDSTMPRPVAHKLREQIVGLAINVYSAYSRAIHDTYQDIVAGAPPRATEPAPSKAPATSPTLPSGSPRSPTSPPAAGGSDGK